ncbi:MAG TPA: beta-N-acetylhexosaminidase [Bryobacteraceae bacterium]|nr:beta-N-acetylhexosaminidase [Bryobacteraceae bacterium]
MRFFCLTCTGGLLATLLASGIAAEPLNLIPAPRSVNHGAGAYVLRSPVRISVVSGSEDDRFAAGLFARELKEVHGLEATVVSQPGGPVLIGRTGTPAIDAEIMRRKLDISALQHPESYLLDAGANGVLVAAKTAEGIYYGVQTLRQLAGTGGRVPNVRIADWPALRYRALSIDINRGPLLTEEQMKQAVETAAEFKFNMVFFYLEHVFRYTHSALAAPRGGEAVTWAYSPLENYSKYIEPFRKSGMDFMVCTAVHNWNRLFPAFATTRPNVNVFARDGKNTGAMGLMATHWADDGEALFNMTWYGVVFSAAAAWQDGLVDTEVFDRSFDWAFYRNRDHTFVGAIRRLEQVHELLRSVRAGEANSTLYWTDPFSRDGAEVMHRARPVASKMRLPAEEAALDLLIHGGTARHHAGTIRFLELAAKRIDYLGMKIQFANEIGELYRELRAAPADDALATNNLRRIKGMDGLLPTLRDYSTEVKAAYRDAWLAENRPYWLDNVLLDYDREALRWVDRIRFFESIHRRYPAAREIPDLEPMGVFLP